MKRKNLPLRINYIIITLILCMIFISPGCQGIATGPMGISGNYICTKGSATGYLDAHIGDILELKSDKTIYWYTPGKGGMSGKWSIDGNEIILSTEFFGASWKGELKGGTVTLEDGSVWVKGQKSASEPANPITTLPKTTKPNSTLTKTDLINALSDLQKSMLEKIDTENQNTAKAFVSVKDYWHSKRWADFARVPLKIIEETISTIGTYQDLKNFSSGVNRAISGAKSASDVLTSIVAYQDLQEVGDKLQLAIDGPTYRASIETMLNAADDSIISPFCCQSAKWDTFQTEHFGIIRRH